MGGVISNCGGCLTPNRASSWTSRAWYAKTRSPPGSTTHTKNQTGYWRWLSAKEIWCGEIRTALAWVTFNSHIPKAPSTAIKTSGTPNDTELSSLSGRHFGRCFCIARLSCFQKLDSVFRFNFVFGIDSFQGSNWSITRLQFFQSLQNLCAIHLIN